MLWPGHREQLHHHLPWQVVLLCPGSWLEGTTYGILHLSLFNYSDRGQKPEISLNIQEDKLNYGTCNAHEKMHKHR
jgi:hypothetical protein